MYGLRGRSSRLAASSRRRLLEARSREGVARGSSRREEISRRGRGSGWCSVSVRAFGRQRERDRRRWENEGRVTSVLDV